MLCGGLSADSAESVKVRIMGARGPVFKYAQIKEPTPSAALSCATSPETARVLEQCADRCGPEAGAKIPRFGGEGASNNVYAVTLGGECVTATAHRALEPTLRAVRYSVTRTCEQSSQVAPGAVGGGASRETLKIAP